MSRRRKGNRYLSSPMYGNCLILAPDGQALCRTNQDKINWYVERSLGEVVSDNPTTLRLFFEPSGRRGAEHPYMTAYKANKCAVCGSEDKITRHHVVPYCFRKHFPERLKRHRMHDVLPMCVKCHDRYEERATEMKQKMSDEIGIPLTGLGVHPAPVGIYSVRSAAHALLHYSDRIPEGRKVELTERLKKHFGKEVITREDLVVAGNLDRQTYDPDYKTFGQCVVERIADFRSFIKEWRVHFIQCMKPQFLPDHWDIDNDL